MTRLGLPLTAMVAAGLGLVGFLALGGTSSPGAAHLLACVLLPMVLGVTARMGLPAGLVLVATSAVLLVSGALLSRGPFVSSAGSLDLLSLIGLPLLCAALAVGLDRGLRTHRKARHELESSLELQRVLHEILRLSTERLPLPVILRRTLDLLFAVRWLGLEARGAVFLRRGHEETLTLAAHRDFPEILQTKCASVAWGQCLCGRAAQSEQPVFASHVDADHETRFGGMPDHGHYCIPIRGDAEVLGVLNLYVQAGHLWRPEEERFLAAVTKALAGVLQQRGAEDALQESEERFKLAIRGTDAGIWDWDLRTDTVYYSPRWKSMLGYDENELEDGFGEWEERLHPEDRDHALATVRAYLAGRSAEFELEHRLRHRDGGYRWIVARGAVVRDQHGEPYRMVGSHIDVTGRHEAETKIQENELQFRAAERIQQRLLPAEAPPLETFDLAGILRPAAFAAGDDFDFLKLPDGRLGLVVSDVSGHGLGPALIMATTHTLMRMLARTGVGLQEMVREANAFLHAETSDARFVTMILVELDPERRTLRYVNAGHPAGWVLDADGRPRLELPATGPALSIFPDPAHGLGDEISMNDGDLLLMMTDGIHEARSPAGTFFGRERALEIVAAHRAEDAATISRRLYDAVREHTRQDHLEDDVTVVVLKALERNEAAVRRRSDTSDRTSTTRYSPEGHPDAGLSPTPSRTPSPPPPSRW